MRGSREMSGATVDEKTRGGKGSYDVASQEASMSEGS